MAYLLALAERLEGEGQLNNAKLLRAAADSLTRRAARAAALPEDPAALPAAMDTAIAKLTESGSGQGLLDALQRGRAALAEGRLPMIHDTPHPFVCRGCGHLVLGDPGYRCPECGALAASFQKFPPIYWLDALDARGALRYLNQTPEDVAMLLDGLSDADMERRPADGGWAIRHILTHIRDAQGVLDFRAKLLLEQDHPVLESLAVFAWATREDEKPPTSREIFTEYRASRQEMLQRLEGIPMEMWLCRGWHEEFGEVTLLQQASYFALHEITHVPKIMELRGEGFRADG
jgi:hypothetical protein